MENKTNDRDTQSLIENKKDNAQETMESVFGFGCAIGEAVKELRGLYTDFVTAWLELEQDEKAPCSPSVANDHLYFLNCIILRLEQLEESSYHDECKKENTGEPGTQSETSAAIDSLKESARILLEIARTERNSMEQANRTA